jgi:hypothetical protein
VFPTGGLEGVQLVENPRLTCSVEICDRMATILGSSSSRLSGQGEASGKSRRVQAFRVRVNRVETVRPCGASDDPKEGPV